MKLQRDIWTQLQKAESDLMGAIRTRNPDIGQLILGDFKLSSYDFMIYFRLVSGFNIQNLSAEAYLQRYPFSSVQPLEEKLGHFSDLGYLTNTGSGVYQITAKGKRPLHHYWSLIRAETERLDLEEIFQADLESLFGILRDILTTMQSVEHPSGVVIFSQRMQGLHPDYDPPALWHLWQYVWSMLAFEEDLRWWRGRQLGIPPLAWHYFWELQRGTKTSEALHRRTLRYAPVPQLEAAGQQALEELQQRGWAESADGPEGPMYALSEMGETTANSEETRVTSEFLGVWPELAPAVLEGVQTFLMHLNHDLERMIP